MTKKNKFSKHNKKVQRISIDIDCYKNKGYAIKMYKRLKLFCDNIIIHKTRKGYHFIGKLNCDFKTSLIIRSICGDDRNRIFFDAITLLKKYEQRSTDILFDKKGRRRVKAITEREFYKR